MLYTYISLNINMIYRVNDKPYSAVDVTFTET